MNERIDQLLGHAANNIAAAKSARDRGRYADAKQNIHCARNILSAVCDMEAGNPALESAATAHPSKSSSSHS